MNTARSSKRKASEFGTSTKPAKQTKLNFNPENKASQITVNSAILEFICGACMPFSIVENPSFCSLIKTLQPNCTVPTRKTIKSKLDDMAKTTKENLCKEFLQVTHVATTTDCWTSSAKSCIGVTVHWFDKDLKRQSAALACRRLRGSHSHDLLAKSLNEIHSEYGIRSKVCRTTTDNGSNFLKAFKVFSEPEASENYGADDNEDVDELDEDDSNEFRAVEIDNLRRCASHTLNLVATSDCKQGFDNATYKKHYRSALAKCQALWNKFGRSAKAKEAVEELCGILLIRPVETRWNSLYDAIERLIRIKKTKGEAVLDALCGPLDVPR